MPMEPLSKAEEAARGGSVYGQTEFAGWAAQPKLVPTVIVWGHGGSHVELEGSFDNWTQARRAGDGGGELAERAEGALQWRRAPGLRRAARPACLPCDRPPDPPHPRPRARPCSPAGTPRDPHSAGPRPAHPASPARGAMRQPHA